MRVGICTSECMSIRSSCNLRRHNLTSQSDFGHISTSALRRFNQHKCAVQDVTGECHRKNSQERLYIKAFLYSKMTPQQHQNMLQHPCNDIDCSSERQEELKPSMLQFLRLLTNVDRICEEEDTHHVLCRC